MPTMMSSKSKWPDIRYWITRLPCLPEKQVLEIRGKEIFTAARSATSVDPMPNGQACPLPALEEARQRHTGRRSVPTDTKPDNNASIVEIDMIRISIIMRSVPYICICHCYPTRWSVTGVAQDYYRHGCVGSFLCRALYVVMSHRNDRCHLGIVGQHRNVVGSNSVLVIVQ